MNRGQAMVEYLIITGLVAVGLLVAADGGVDRLAIAFAEAFARFTEAVSRP